MDVSLFDFDLPDSLIAVRPAIPRDAARMLVVYPTGERRHLHVRDLPEFLNPPDLFVVNDTKVIAARLFGHRLSRSATLGQVSIEFLLHKRLAADAYSAFARPAKRLRIGDIISFVHDLSATVRKIGEQGEVEITFNADGLDLDAAVAKAGQIPLPPYIASKRKADDCDQRDYQTIYASKSGSVAAPTAGLHITPELLSRLSEKGVTRADVTLHIGAGTFRPVSVEDTSLHRMHAEEGIVAADTASAVNATWAHNGKVLALGTTSLRTLETAATSLREVEAFSGETDIFITPGYNFKTADLLLTNFHLPRSTLFMLVSAFMGLDLMKDIYEEAIREGYRFFSYGDACLLMRTR